MATAGTISGLVIQALRYMGRTHVTDDTVERLDRRLSPDDRKQLSKDVAYAPAWVGNIMRRLAGKSWNMDDFTKLDPEDRSIHILGGDGDAEELAGGNSGEGHLGALDIEGTRSSPYFILLGRHSR